MTHMRVVCARFSSKYAKLRKNDSWHFLGEIVFFLKAELAFEVSFSSQWGLDWSGSLSVMSPFSASDNAGCGCYISLSIVSHRIIPSQVITPLLQTGPFSLSPSPVHEFRLSFQNISFICCTSQCLSWPSIQCSSSPIVMVEPTFSACLLEPSCCSLLPNSSNPFQSCLHVYSSILSTVLWTCCNTLTVEALAHHAADFYSSSLMVFCSLWIALAWKSAVPSAFLFKMHLSEKQSDRHGEFCILWITPLKAPTARSGSGWSQEPGAPTWTLMCVAKWLKYLSHHPQLFQANI